LKWSLTASRIARRGVILVSVNYRLNVFGFYPSGNNQESPDGFVANWGYLDQKAGIDWVRRNIANLAEIRTILQFSVNRPAVESVLAHLNSPWPGVLLKRLSFSLEAVSILRVYSEKMGPHLDLQDWRSRVMLFRYIGASTWLRQGR